MPAADTTVTVTYAPCRTLSLSHSGAGSNPIASPPNSDGCGAGKYAAGESIVFNAVPGRGPARQGVERRQRHACRRLAGQQPDHAQRRRQLSAWRTKPVSHSAPASAAAATPSFVAPATSAGCLTGGFAAGQNLTLRRQPCSGLGGGGVERDERRQQHGCEQQRGHARRRTHRGRDLCATTGGSQPLPAGHAEVDRPIHLGIAKMYRTPGMQTSEGSGDVLVHVRSFLWPRLRCRLAVNDSSRRGAPGMVFRKSGIRHTVRI